MKLNKNMRQHHQHKQKLQDSCKSMEKHTEEADQDEEEDEDNDTYEIDIEETINSFNLRLDKIKSTTTINKSSTKLF